MKLFRRRVIVCAIALLVCQTAATGVATLVFDCVGQAAKDVVECTCAHDPGATCTRHKTPTPQDSGTPSHQMRWCAVCADPSDTVVSTVLTGPAGLPEIRHRLDRPSKAAGQALFYKAHARDFARPPVSPPPRS